jgi:hypothetical protein
VDAPRRLRESDLEGHFTHEEAAPEIVSDTVGSSDSEDSDQQLARAVEVLKSWTYFERLKETPAAASVQARTVDDR